MKRELELKFVFLKNFRLFDDLSQIRLQKLVLNMGDTISFKRGQPICRQDSNDTKGVFLVSFGEFEISKNISKFKYDAADHLKS